jgi:hypothetical protein
MISVILTSTQIRSLRFTVIGDDLWVMSLIVIRWSVISTPRYRRARTYSIRWLAEHQRVRWSFKYRLVRWTGKNATVQNSRKTFLLWSVISMGMPIRNIDGYADSQYRRVRWSAISAGTLICNIDGYADPHYRRVRWSVISTGTLIRNINGYADP